MKKLLWFTGLAWVITFTQTTYAVGFGAKLSVSGGVQSSTTVSDSSSPFTIADSTTLNTASGASTAGSTSSQGTSVVTPAGSSHFGATAGAASRPAGTTSQAGASSSSNSGVPTQLSSLSPVLTSLIQHPGNAPGTAVFGRRGGYTPTPVNNRNPGTPTGLSPFNPTPTGPGGTTHASVPDGGATLSLLGMGLLGTALMKKKLAK